jgi:hypothetical protein
MTGSMNVKFHQSEAAAHYIRSKYGQRCSAGWLAKLAVVGGGPTFRKAGRNRIYTEEDLDAWAQSRMSGPMRSTSEAA